MTLGADIGYRSIAGWVGVLPWDPGVTALLPKALELGESVSIGHGVSPPSSVAAVAVFRGLHILPEGSYGDTSPANAGHPYRLDGGSKGIDPCRC